VSEEVLEAEMSSIPNDESSSLPADTVALPDARMVRFSPTETSTPVRGGPVSSKSRDTPYPRPSSHGQFAGSDDSNSSLSPSVESPGSRSQDPNPSHSSQTWLGEEIARATEGPGARRIGTISTIESRRVECEGGRLADGLIP
jgi:hypothetical protein